MHRLGIALIFAFSLVSACAAVSSFCEEGVAADRRQRQNDARRREQERRRAKENERARVRGQIQRTKASVESAKRFIQVARQQAQVAGTKAAAAIARAETALSQIKNLEAAAAQATEQLKAVESEIQAAQGQDSELQRAIDGLLAAETKFAAAREAAFESPDYQAAYRRALTAVDKAEQMLRVRREATENNAEYQQAMLELDGAQARMERVRKFVYEGNASWVAAAEEARRLREELAKANQSLKNALLSKTAANTVLRDATGKAQKAYLFIQRGESALKRLQSQEKSLSSNSRR